MNVDKNNMAGRRVEVTRTLLINPKQDHAGWMLDEWRDKLYPEKTRRSIGTGLVGQWVEDDVWAVFFLNRDTYETDCRFVRECDMLPTDKETTLVYDV